MQTTQYISLALVSALGVAACADRAVGDTMGSTAATNTGTSGPDPNDSGASGSEPTTGPIGDPEVYEQCQAFYDAETKGVEAQCVCRVLSGEYPDAASCLAAHGPSLDEVRCVCKIYSNHPETRAILDCLTPPLNSFAECYTQAGCNDEAAQKECGIAYLTVSNDCPAPSKTVDFELRIMCDGENPVGCGSGEQIPEGNKCDFIPDCMDGSDEVNCPLLMCMSGEAILKELGCDGKADCLDGSDEASCAEQRPRPSL
jgi:hypothetical protein